MRLVLHTAAYWLMLTVRDAIPKPQPLATAEFTTLRLRLLKIAARVTETATRVRIAFAAACPEAELVPRRRAQPATRRAMTAGAIAPEPASSYQPQRPAPPNAIATKSGAKPIHARRSEQHVKLNPQSTRFDEGLPA